MTTYDEWRVTGGLTTIEVSKTFRSEDEARAYADRMAANGPLGIGPHLHRRTVVVTKWRPVDTTTGEQP